MDEPSQKRARIEPEAELKASQIEDVECLASCEKTQNVENKIDKSTVDFVTTEKMNITSNDDESILSNDKENLHVTEVQLNQTDKSTDFLNEECEKIANNHAFSASKADQKAQHLQTATSSEKKTTVENNESLNEVTCVENVSNAELVYEKNYSAFNFTSEKNVTKSECTEKSNQVEEKTSSTSEIKISTNDETDSVDDDEIVTMEDFLADYDDEVSSMFGGLRDDECTYKLGAMTRQPLYACLTCVKDKTEPAACCYACSINCHGDDDKHEVIEMYTKRNFTCDCGNEKFKEKCKLNAEKKPVNNGNHYDQTFMGKNCKCHRPYPDDAPDACSDDMIQCIVCEDWFHLTHLKLHEDDKEKTESDFAELICDGCMGGNARSLVCYYEKLRAFAPGELPTVDETESQKSDVKTCSRPETSATYESNEEPFATFWKYEWRKHICRCTSCLNDLQLNGILFVSDWDDSMLEYERRARKADKEEEEAKLAKIPYVIKQLMGQFVHVLDGSFKEFFSTLPEEYLKGKPITADLVQQFVEKSQGELKEKMAKIAFKPPDNCR